MLFLMVFRVDWGRHRRQRLTIAKRTDNLQVFGDVSRFFLNSVYWKPGICILVVAFCSLVFLVNYTFFQG